VSLQKELLKSFNGNPPADTSVIESFERANFKLPTEYVHFLYIANGGEGWIGPNSYVIFWRIEELVELNNAYEVQKNARGLFIFGSDGGGEAFAFDLRHSSIVRVPFIGMALESVEDMAPDFGTFIHVLFEQSE